MNKEELVSFKQNLEITDDQIDVVFSKLKLEPDDKQKEFIKTFDTVDVHAVPGAGKTTMLAVKIAGLLENWHKLENQNAGICIMSHTNAAKDEILKDLYELGYKDKIEKFPHFIGTIQEFVNKFFGFPYIKSKCWEFKYFINEINFELLESLFKKKDLKITDEYKNKAKKIKLNKESYKISFIINRGDISKNNFYYSYEDSKLCIPKFYSIFKDKEYILNRKIYSCKNGYFCYEDMYAFSFYLIDKYKYLPEIIRKRFPICFVDEYQDNDKKQDDLLESLFSNGCIYQRIGDPNQAIYDFNSDNNENTFNNNSRHHLSNNIFKNLDMVNSYRFKGTKIKDLLQKLASDNTKSEAVGYDSQDDTIIKIIPINIEYKESKNRDSNYGDCLSSVKDKYITIIKESFGNNAESYNYDNNNDIQYYAVAANAKDPGKIHIQKYFNEYSKNKQKDKFKSDSFIDYFYFAKNELNANIRKGFKVYYDLILDVLAKHCNLTEDKKSIRTKSALKEHLIKNDKICLYNKLIARTLEIEIINEEKWCKCIVFIKNCLTIDINIMDDYFKYKTEETNLQINNKSFCSDNIYEKEDIKIKFGTIHSVKGQTHNATLVLMTENGGFDIEKLFTRTKKNKKYADFNKISKNWYVAASRPKKLLCMAIPQTIIDSDEFPIGWKELIYKKENP